MNDISCNKGHNLTTINNGLGTYSMKTKCILCDFTNTNTEGKFLSCATCNYNLCHDCQQDQLKVFETQKLSNECHYDEKNLKYVQGYLDKKSCLSDCGKDSDGYIICRCGKKYCLNCFSICFPEDETLIKKNSEIHSKIRNSRESLSKEANSLFSKGSKEIKKSNLGKDSESEILTKENKDNKSELRPSSLKLQCYHEKNKFKYNNSHLGLVCLGGCERESEGFLQCTCSKKLCVICFETIFPEEKGKYLYEIKPVNNGCKHNKENLIYCMKKINDTRCAMGCRRPSNGYMECICGQNICISCFEEIHPEDAGKYGILPREHLNLGLHSIDSTDQFGYSKSVSYKEKLLEEKADIDSVHTDNNYLLMKCKSGHELTYSKNYDSQRCSKCNDKGIVIWSCKRCNYYHCKNCIDEEIKERISCTDCKICCNIF